MALLFEGAASLMLARLALWAMPFRLICRWLDRPLLPKVLSDGERRTARRDVKWAINRSMIILPGTWKCFPQALAAFALLRRRGVSATLYYGAVPTKSRDFESHVWLKDGEADIVGCEVEHAFEVLAHFPKVTC